MSPQLTLAHPPGGPCREVTSLIRRRMAMINRIEDPWAQFSAWNRLLNELDELIETSYERYFLHLTEQNWP